MRKIGLTQGKVALVDDEDFEYINQWKWCAHRRHGNIYADRKFKMESGKVKTVAMHQLIMGETPIGMEIDHKDGNGSNNQRPNLRFVTSRQNKQNRHTFKTSKYAGVSFDKVSRKWKAQAKIGGFYKNLGRYQDEETAYLCYCNALKEIGEMVVGATI